MEEITREEFINKKVEELFEYTPILQCLTFCSHCDYAKLVYYFAFDVQLIDISENARALYERNFLDKTNFPYKEDKIEFLIPLIQRVERYCTRESFQANEEEQYWLKMALDNCIDVTNELLQFSNEYKKGNSLVKKPYSHTIISKTK